MRRPRPARAYWMVDLPGLAPVDVPSLTAVTRRDDGEDERGPLSGRVALGEPFPVTIDLQALVLSGRWA